MTRIWRLLWAATAGAAVLAACTVTSEQELAFDLRIVDKELVDPGDLSVKQGDKVTINWTSDAPASVHLHGYDIEIEVSPDEPGRMAFAADATGGFDITLHALTGAGGEQDNHGHSEHSGDACSEPLPEGVSPVLSVGIHPSADPMSFDVSVQVQDPPPGPLHWHLYINGGLKAMASHPTARLDLNDPGDYQVMVVLSSDATHCEYDVSATTTLTAGGHGSDMETDHGGDRSEVTLTRLIVNP